MIHFTKAHAYGNDFLYVDQFAVAGVDMPELARQMCHRTTGIGADGLIAYSRTTVGASMVLLCDLAARMLFRALGTEPPVGAVTAMIGGPLFLVMLARPPART